MSNVVKIKHGSNAPTTTQLENYELGYASSENGLYIKNDEEIIKINDISAVEQSIEVLDAKVTNIVSQVTGIEVGIEEPKNPNVLWIDTNPDSYGSTVGVAKYCINPNATTEAYEWVEVAATWG